MKKLTLSIKERVHLQGILHTMEGRRIEAITLSSVLAMITFTADEIQALSLKDLPDGKVTWNAKSAYDSTYELTDEQVFILKKSMDMIEQRGKLSIDLLSLDTKITTL